MHPVLVHIPFIHQPIHMYGALILVGFLLALQVSKWYALKQGIQEQDVMDFAFWALLGGLIGARIVFIAVNWEEYFVTNPWTELGSLGITIPSAFTFWQGGLVYWGGFLGGFAASIVYAWARKLPSLQFFDILVVGVPLAQVFGRFGCIASGCCYGRALSSPESIGLRFPAGSAAYDTLIHSSELPLREYMIEHAHTWPLFPSQLLESAGSLVLFFALVYLANRKRFHGQLLLTYAAAYSVMRSAIELFRGDLERGYVLDGILSTSQFISLCVILITLSATMALKSRP
ncbi:MAG: prolipoprotein diacylglyceryl transferase [Myxococcaceae bacterium]|nr:prolipoprotein diacylglyceryl transferase [Myxococcaceae bacterium]MBH2006009.1 prolipoprotein diacylglyceryl transferase [Myxococcaceae bacterium]